MTATAKALRHDERGIALVLALLILLVIAIALSSTIYFTSTNSRSAAYSKAEQTAQGLAEAGVNNALAIVMNPDNRRFLQRDTLLPTQSSPTTTAYEGGTVTWWGKLDRASDPASWLITARGTVKNPTGAGALDVKRTLTTRVPIAQGVLYSQLGVWNWVFSDTTGHPCDTTFLNQGAMYTKVYVKGNLCLQNQAVVQAPIYVGGKLYSVQPATGVGTSGNPVSDAFIGNGCQYKSNGLYYVPCVVDGTRVGGVAARTNVFAQNLVTSGTPPSVFSGVSLPHVYWDEAQGSWYEQASPGPWNPCWDPSQRQYGPDGVKSTGPVPKFDTMVWNPIHQEWEPDGWGGATGGDSPDMPFNLTPDVSYTCKTVNGELSWDNTKHVLTVKGVIFIDGDVTAQVKTNVVSSYKGVGVIYATGSFFMGSTKLCATPGSSDCDWSAWDPNKTILIIATHNQDRQPNVSVGDGVEVKSSSFQGGFYSDYNVQLDTASQVQGPIVSAGTVTMGNQFASTFPPITIDPLGIPGVPPNPYAEQPTGYSG